MAELHHTIYLDGVDLAPYGTPAGYSVGYDIKDGGQGGLMLDGSERVDELAKWPVITYPCMPLTQNQLQTLLGLVMTSSVHTLNYYDPAAGQQTKRVRRSVSNPKFRGVGADGNMYWTGTVLTFKVVE